MTSPWEGERVRLRAVEPDDWAALHSFSQEADIVRAGESIHPPRSAERARQWAGDLAARDADPDEPRLVVAARDGDAPLGMINAHQVDRLNGTFAYGVSLGSRHHRQGYGGEAVVLLLRYMFGERRFQKAEAWVYASNAPSLALHRRLGFVEEGRRRRSHYSGGRWDDEVLFGMTVEEFAGLHGLQGALGGP
ncbi:GNAT family protein [Nonomuraea muscovyensis]|uniref:GNAT family N-acetyltransferase n=1 Tax=Nonomuraea muscovyensis TaxID=1124761 RepID=UPI003404AD6E